ncbi:MAG: nucleotide exchange factor GrpE [Candidatus Moraniibacteriota bacterium]
MTHKKKHQREADQEPDIENEAGAAPEPQEGIPKRSAPEAETTEKLAEEYLNDLKRCQAEFENYKKRQAAQQKELGGYLIEKLVLDIIPVLDNFRSATLHVPAEQKDSPWVVGIQYIEKQLESVLTDNGMRTIEVTEGEAFDPKIHEAVDSQQSTDNSQQEKQVVAKVIQKGYRFGDRVIRPAKVTVS